MPQKHKNPAAVKRDAIETRFMVAVPIELTGEEIEQFHDEIFGLSRTQYEEDIDFEAHTERYKKETKARDVQRRDIFKMLKSGYKETHYDTIYVLYDAKTDEAVWYSEGGDELHRTPANENEKQLRITDEASAEA